MKDGTQTPNEQENGEIKQIETPNEQENGETEQAAAACPRGGVKKAVRITLRCIGYFVLALLVVIVVWMLVDKYIKKSPAPGAFGFSPLIVATGSMSGTIEAGDMIIIHAQKEYKTGDIVTFLPEGDTIPTTHRIIGITDEGYFRTKGDANNAADKTPISQDMILGEVVLVIPGIGMFFQWIATGGGWIFVVAAILIVGVGIYLLRKVK